MRRKMYKDGYYKLIRILKDGDQILSKINKDLELFKIVIPHSKMFLYRNNINFQLLKIFKLEQM